MDRLTIKNKDGYFTVDDEDIQKAIQRLGMFEDAYEGLMKSQEQIPIVLEELRKQGKEKTLSFKETMAQKLINSNIIMFFKRHGIK